MKFSEIFYKELLKRTALLAGTLFLLFAGKDAELVIYRTYLLRHKIDALVLLKYYLMIFPDIIITLLPVGVSASFLWTISKMKSENYFRFLALRGENTGQIFSKGWKYYFAIALVLFAAGQFAAKPLKKAANIVLDDELIRDPKLAPQMELNADTFHKIGPDQYLYFGRATLDSVKREHPVLLNVFYWDQNTKDPRFLFAENADIKEGDVILEYPIIYHVESRTYEPYQNRPPEYTIPGALSSKIEKQESVHYSSLTLAELFEIKKSANALGAHSGWVWAYILFPFVNLFLLPLLAIWLFAGRKRLA